MSSLWLSLVAASCAAEEVSRMSGAVAVEEGEEMIKTVTEEKRFCDVAGCDNEAYEWTKCLGCGQDLCPESAWESISKKHAVRLAHGIYTSGSDDGYYCLPCDIRLSEDKSDSLHCAYSRIRELRDKRERNYQKQQAIEKEAEADVKRIRSTRGL